MYGTNVAGQTVNGGVVYDQTVTTNRFGTTTYSGWYQVNFLCTAIPYPPSCPSGQNQASAPYWDWGSNSWQGLVCISAVCASELKVLIPNYYPNVFYTNTNFTGLGIDTPTGSAVDASEAHTPGGANVATAVCYFDSNNVLNFIAVPGTIFGQPAYIVYKWTF